MCVTNMIRNVLRDLSLQIISICDDSIILNASFSSIFNMLVTIFFSYNESSGTYQFKFKLKL